MTKKTVDTSSCTGWGCVWHCFCEKPGNPLLSMICDRNVPSVASGLRAVRVELDNAFLVLDNAILVLSLSIAIPAPKFTEAVALFASRTPREQPSEIPSIFATFPRSGKGMLAGSFHCCTGRDAAPRPLTPWCVHSHARGDHRRAKSGPGKKAGCGWHAVIWCPQAGCGPQF